MKVLTELYNMADINSTENNLFTQRQRLSCTWVGLIVILWDIYYGHSVDKLHSRGTKIVTILWSVNGKYWNYRTVIVDMYKLEDILQISVSIQRKAKNCWQYTLAFWAVIDCGQNVRITSISMSRWPKYRCW